MIRRLASNPKSKCHFLGISLLSEAIIWSRSSCLYSCLKLKNLKTEALGVSSRKTSLPNQGTQSSTPSASFSSDKPFSSQKLTVMPPIVENMTGEVKKLIEDKEVLVFSKTTCPFCTKAKDLLTSLNVKFEAVEIDKIEQGPKYQAALKELTGQSTVPNIFIHGQHLGGCDNLLKAHSDNRLSAMFAKNSSNKFEYDLAVIGGGSGGLAAAKEAAGFGKKVILFDFVTPSPPGTTWGLGGTCVNVGCIPKKLMHRASILGEDVREAREFGWEFSKDGVHHNWETMTNNIQDHIGSLNWGYRVALRDKKVTYANAYAQIVEKNKIKGVNKKKEEKIYTAEHILIATGERPRYPDIPGAKEFAITSDDLFSLPYSPGKTLCVGASYVALECAGFLSGLGLDTTVMVRSILLRGFDQQCAELIGKHMENDAGVKFIRGAVPTKIEEIEKGNPGRYKVTAKTTSGEEVVGEYNTILMAIGRDPCTSGIGLENIGVKLHEKSNRVLVNEKEETNVKNVFAVGDIGEGRPELTPVAIQAGKLLARRLFQFGGNKTLVDYTNVPTTVFTPLEYGAIGYSEEAAIEAFGEDNIEIYHSHYLPLEWTVPHKDTNTCYAKLICKRTDNKVIGFHVLGPNAGEITQGYAVAMKKGATKDDFDATIGIHPTNSEVFTTLKVTKRSGETAEVTGC